MSGDVTVSLRAYGHALRSRPLRGILTGHGASTVAQQVVVLGVGAFVHDRTDSALWTAATIALGFAPYALFSAHAGALADRLPRSSVLRWSSALRVISTAALLATMLVDAPIGLIVSFAAVTAVLATPAYPAVTAGAVQCVADRDLPAANALAAGVENIAWLIGPGVLGVVLLLGFGPVEAIATAGVMFALAWFAVLRVHLPRPKAQGDGTFTGKVWPVVKSMAQSPAVRPPFLLAVIDNGLYGYLVVALVLLTLGPGANARLGLLNAALTLGALSALLVVNFFAARRRLGLTLFVLLSVFAASIAVLGFAGATILGVVAVGIAGVATIVTEVICVTLLQRATHESTHGRVFGVYDVVNVGAVAVGSLVAGVASDLVGTQAAAVAVSIACVALAALAARRLLLTPKP